MNIKDVTKRAGVYIRAIKIFMDTMEKTSDVKPLELAVTSPAVGQPNQAGKIWLYFSGHAQSPHFVLLELFLQTVPYFRFAHELNFSNTRMLQYSLTEDHMADQRNGNKTPTESEIVSELKRYLGEQMRNHASESLRLQQELKKNQARLELLSALKSTRSKT